MKKLLVFVSVFFAAAMLVNYSFASSTMASKEFQVSKGGKFTLDTDIGAIEIATHDNNSVAVSVIKEGRNADDFRVRFDQNGRDVSIKGKKSVSSFFNPTKVKFKVMLPSQFNVEIETNGGSIKISSLEGSVQAFTSGGSIRLGNIKGDVNIKTSGGSIKVDEVDGNIMAHTSGGSIRVKYASQFSKDSRLSTSGGSIKAELNRDIKVNLLAKTSGGSVRTDFAVDGEIKRTKIDGKINGGGPKLTLKTSGGSIRVSKLKAH